MGMMRCIEAQPAESDGVRLLRFEVGKRAMENRCSESRQKHNWPG